MLQGEGYEVQAKYLIAADGASSRVRKQLGIGMIGEPAMQHLVNIHFFSRDLWQHVKQRPAMLYFVFNSQAIVVLVAHNQQEGKMFAQVHIHFFSRNLLQHVTPRPAMMCFVFISQAIVVLVAATYKRERWLLR